MEILIRSTRKRSVCGLTYKDRDYGSNHTLDKGRKRSMKSGIMPLFIQGAYLRGIEKSRPHFGSECKNFLLHR